QPLAGLLDASGPGANRRVSTAVGVQQRERIGRARLAVDGDENTASARQRLEDPAVVRLKTGTAHRAGDAKLREIARAALQGGNQRSARDDGAEAGDLETIGRRSQKLLNQRRGF